jgi:nicotinate phosphoribosyltransferase
VVTGSGAPAAGFVYKLAAHLDDDGNWMPVGKRSAEKATVAGRKLPVRALDDGIAHAEHIYVEEPLATDVGRELLVDLVVDGTPVAGALGPEGVLAARTHHAAAIAELPPEALALHPGEPAIPTVYF